MGLPSIALLRRVLRPRVFLGTLLLFAALMFFTWATVSRAIDHQAERLLTAAQRDLTSTYHETIDYALAFTANAIIDELRTVTPLDREAMRRLARVYGVDEINLADTSGVWVASTEREGIVGDRLDIHPKTAEFLYLMSPTATSARVAQEFRPSVAHPEQCRKYLGMIFDDRSGVIQLGLDAHRAAMDFERSYESFVKDWFGEDDDRYFIIARADGTIVECGHRPEATPKTLAEIGYDKRKESNDRSQTFRQRLFGEPCRCRSSKYYKYNFITVIPDAHFRELLQMSLYTSFTILFFLTLLAFVLSYNAERQRLETSRREAELENRRKADMLMARSIQKSALPAVFPPYPRDFMMDIYASMTPARDIGGDFYDFQYVGNDRLAFLVADVSGKGVPAALFMMKAKTILQALTLSSASLSDAIAAANNRLCEGNEADMFVTCWIGILDERSGLLRYVNAGHNPPYICRAGTGVLEPLDEISGLFLGGMRDVRYKTFQKRLAPGDLVFLYTDGVTEAHNAFNEMFGESRLEEVLRGERGMGLARFMSRRRLPSPRQICLRMRSAVDAFAGQTSQFDDITMLALRFRGIPAAVSKSVPVEMASVPELNAFAEETLKRVECPDSAKADLLVALDELANNIASYSGARVMTLTVETAQNPSVVRLRLVDDGQPWNPLDHLDPDVTLSADEREIGGLGILMVKKLMDDVAYVRRDGMNQFSVRKSLEPEVGA